MIKLAKYSDLDIIVIIAKSTRNDMLKRELKQWIGDYPSFTDFSGDYKKNGLYICIKNNKIIGSISLLTDSDSEYKKIAWKRNHSLVIHRLLVSPDFQRKGIEKPLLIFSIDFARKNGYESIKIDTHPENYRMQGLIKKLNFIEIGYLSKINRLGYELVL